MNELKEAVKQYTSSYVDLYIERQHTSSVGLRENDKSMKELSDNLVKFIEQFTTRKELEARIDGMESAKSRVLRRTEIPRDAKNPTRDWIVILGEEIAGFIDDDITQLSTELTNKEMK